MKDILVEFTDYGAKVHKDPSVIAEKKGLSHCLFNPDLSKVSGVSPSYWVCNKDGEILPASLEEQKRRDEYHQSKPPENVLSLKQTLDEIREEIDASVVENKDCLEKQIKELEQLINIDKQNLHDINNQLTLIINHSFDMFVDFRDSTSSKLKDLNIQLKNYKTALIVCFILALLGIIL